MKEAADDIAANDTERLLTNARFLQERFASSSLEPATATATAAVGASQSHDGPGIL
jgi:hypothetical protein